MGVALGRATWWWVPGPVRWEWGPGRAREVAPHTNTRVRRTVAVATQIAR